MKPFSFVHVADLHLGSPFRGLGLNNPEIASLLQSATYEAFLRCLDLCIENGVDFLLIAGDIFEDLDKNLAAQLRFCNSLKRLSEAGIRTFIVHGNHDPVNSWLRSLVWSPGVYIFGSEGVERVSIEKEGEVVATVHGISYGRREEYRNLVQGFRREGEGFQIGLLHCNIGPESGHEPYAPCTVSDLLKAGMDYWALGHVHERRILSPVDPCILYPGNIQGRNIKEQGEKGCYLVRVSAEGEPSLRFYPTDVVRWIYRELSLRNLSSEQGLQDLLQETMDNIREEAAGRPVICRLVLKGATPLYGCLMQTPFLSDLLDQLREYGLASSPFIWLERIELQARPPLDLETRKKGDDFVGVLLRYCEELKSSPQLEELLKPDLSPLYLDHRVAKYLRFPSPQLLRELLEEAEGICLETLTEIDLE